MVHILMGMGPPWSGLGCTSLVMSLEGLQLLLTLGLLV